MRKLNYTGKICVVLYAILCAGSLSGCSTAMQSLADGTDAVLNGLADGTDIVLNGLSEGADQALGGLSEADDGHESLWRTCWRCGKCGPYAPK